jgi:hypothetical protein
MLLAFMTPIFVTFNKEHHHPSSPPYKKEYWQNELKSLGIEPKQQNELNDRAELEALTEIIKQVYYQDYKTAYVKSSSSSNNTHSNI